MEQCLETRIAKTLKMWLLKSLRNPIPGNYVYTQTQGIVHEFAAQPFIEGLANDVSAFRRANKLLRADLVSTFEDIDRYNCTIRNNDPQYCYDCQGSFADARANHPYIRKDCPTCGVKINPK